MYVSRQEALDKSKIKIQSYSGDGVGAGSLLEAAREEDHKATAALLINSLPRKRE